MVLSEKYSKVRVWATLDKIKFYYSYYCNWSCFDGREEEPNMNAYVGMPKFIVIVQNEISHSG